MTGIARCCWAKTRGEVIHWDDNAGKSLSSNSEHCRAYYSVKTTPFSATTKSGGMVMVTLVTK